MKPKRKSRGERKAPPLIKKGNEPMKTIQLSCGAMSVKPCNDSDIFLFSFPCTCDVPGFKRFVLYDLKANHACAADFPWSNGRFNCTKTERLPGIALSQDETISVAEIVYSFFRDGLEASAARKMKQAYPGSFPLMDRIAGSNYVSLWGDGTDRRIECIVPGNGSSDEGIILREYHLAG